MILTCVVHLLPDHCGSIRVPLHAILQLLDALTRDLVFDFERGPEC